MRQYGGSMGSIDVGTMPASPLKVLWWTAAALMLAGAGCGKEPPSPTTRPGKITVASLVPAATDLIIGMGAADQLVAVSTYDRDRPGLPSLPRVGDYQNTDWERLRQLRPQMMIVQIAPERMPAGLQQRCDDVGFSLLNIRIERLEDIFTAMQEIGAAMGRPAEAAAAEKRLRQRIEAVKQRVAGRPPVATLIVHDDDAQQVIGPDTFLDDLLSVAGGTNVAAGLRRRYPSIDREMLRTLKPQAVIQLLPEAPPHVLEKARRVWQAMADLPAVRDGRVHLLIEWYTQQPGLHVADVAEKFADLLHPTAASTRSAP